jgi:hypothetical protein
VVRQVAPIHCVAFATLAKKTEDKCACLPSLDCERYGYQHVLSSRVGAIALWREEVGQIRLGSFFHELVCLGLSLVNSRSKTTLSSVRHAPDFQASYDEFRAGQVCGLRNVVNIT